MNRPSHASSRDPVLAEGRPSPSSPLPSTQWEQPPQPSMMAQRLRAAATASPPPTTTAAVASAPKTRPFEVQPPPAHLYSTAADPWNPGRANIQVAPSRPPKIYDAPPPAISYRRPSATPERRGSAEADVVVAPTKPPKLSIDSRVQRSLEPRLPSPPSLTHSRSASHDQQTQRASAIHPPAAPVAATREPSPAVEQEPKLPPRPARRPFDIDPSPDFERRGSGGSRPFEVRPPPNPLDLSTDRREGSRPFDIPFRSPMHFPPVASEGRTRAPSLVPEVSARKGSTPTFEFEPPSAPSVQKSAPQEVLVEAPRWFDSHEASPPSPKSAASPLFSPPSRASPPSSLPARATSPSPPSQTSTPSPQTRAPPPSRLTLAATEKILPPPGPPPTKHKSKKSVSFATRDSIISATAYPQSPFSDDSNAGPEFPRPPSSDYSNDSPRNSSDERLSLAELPIFLRIEGHELEQAIAETVDDAPPAVTKPSSSSLVTPLFIPPPPGPPPTLVEQPSKKDEGMDFDHAVAQLVDYGFSPEEAQKGLLENGSGINVQAAANWLLDEANQPSPPPLPQRPGQNDQYEIDPPSPLSPSDDASSDLYEPEPVSPVSLYAAPLPRPRANTSRVPAQHRYSCVFPDDVQPLPPAGVSAQPPSPPNEKQDTTPFETYRPSSSPPPTQAPPSPPSSKAASLEQQEVPAQPPSYSSLEHRAQLPNPLHSHPVQVEPFVPAAPSHKIPRKRVPLPSLDTGLSGSSASSSTVTPPASTRTSTSALAAATMASFATAVAPVAPEVQPQADFTPLSSQHTSSSSVSSLTSTTISPRSSTDTGGRAPRKRKGSLSKGWGSRFAEISQKANKGIANLAIKVNHAGFVGETVEKECDKAARILRAFCKHGVYANPASGTPSPFSPETPSAGDSTQPLQPTSSNGSSKSEKRLVKIPPEILQKAVGLAIFTTLRVGLGLGESTGSGIVIARLHDGSWSPPSAIQLQSFGAGVAAGVDIFDCVCVINTQEALGAFMNTRFSLGAGVAVAAGPWGTGRSIEWGSMHNRDRDGKRSRKTSLSEDDSANSPPPAFELNGEPLAIQEPKNRRQGNTVTMSPVYSYVKSKGLFAGLTYEGNVVIERKEANKKFYQDDVTVEQILRGAVRAPEGQESLKALHEALLAAEDYGSARNSVMGPIPGGPGGPAAPPTIQEEGVVDAGPSTEPQTNWPMDVKPKFPEDSLHPAEAFGIRQH